MSKQLELLSPAKNLEQGIAAINFGADAVYVGADKFSARQQVGVNLFDIEKLIQYAHRYHCKVYIAINTILFDNELKKAEQLAISYYNMGADALIVQDMAFLDMNLPPIPLHASTQMDNRKVEKIQLLEKLGFSRVILARDLSLDEIKKINMETTIELEAFIHGALCTSYSGQCYLSLVCGNRSANRGVCAQPCRLPYDLVDSSGEKIIENQYLLSLKDFSAEKYILDLVQAGICSFKIEGRLKDINYVKNVTAYYRKKLDAITAANNDYKRSSLGECKFNFTPDIERSFNRGFTNYFLVSRNQAMANPHNIKSIGKEIGYIKAITDNFIKVNLKDKVNNGDGLCYFDENNELKGFLVNKCKGDIIYPSKMPEINENALLYRNVDYQFEKVLQNHVNPRKIPVEIIVYQEESLIYFVAIVTNTSINAHIFLSLSDFAVANNEEKCKENLIAQLSKTGNHNFTIRNIEINCHIGFLPISKLNELRRNLFSLLDEAILTSYYRKYRNDEQKKVINYINFADYTCNIANAKAEHFYQKLGASIIEPALEISNNFNDKVIFRSRFCLKYQLNLCKLKQKTNKKSNDYVEPFFLINKYSRFRIQFDCINCEMELYKTS